MELDSQKVYETYEKPYIFNPQLQKVYENIQFSADPEAEESILRKCTKTYEKPYIFNI